MNKFERLSIIAFCLILAGFIFLTWVASAAFAQQPNSAVKQSRCSSIEQFVETLNRLPAEIRNTLHVRILRGDDAQRWVVAFNAVPPASNLRMDRVVFVTGSREQPVIIAGELDGCVTGVTRLPMQLHELLLKDSNNERGDAV